MRTAIVGFGRDAKIETGTDGSKYNVDNAMPIALPTNYLLVESLTVYAFCTTAITLAA
jgi:hypothetical protein